MHAVRVTLITCRRRQTERVRGAIAIGGPSDAVSTALSAVLSSDGAATTRRRLSAERFGPGCGFEHSVHQPRHGYHAVLSVDAVEVSAASLHDFDVATYEAADRVFAALAIEQNVPDPRRRIRLLSVRGR